MIAFPVSSGQKLADLNKEQTWTEPQTFEAGATYGPTDEDASIELPRANQATGENGNARITFSGADIVLQGRVNDSWVTLETWNMPDVFTASFSDGIVASGSFGGSQVISYNKSFSDGIEVSDTFSSAVDTGECSTYSSDKCTGGTATASSQYNAGSAAPYAVDNNTTTTQWTSSGTSNQWWQYDFGSEVAHAIIKVRILPHSSVGNAFTTASIQGSNNGSDWTTLVSNTGTLGDSFNDIIFENTTAYRYIRLNGLTTTHFQGLYSILEVEMMTCDD